jgi:hypothetical protein
LGADVGLCVSKSFMLCPRLGVLGKWRTQSYTRIHTD